VNDAARERLALTSRLFKILRSPDFRHAYNKPGPSGHHQYLAALPDDPMRIVFDHLRTHPGQNYMVVPVPSEEGEGISVVSLEVESSPSLSVDDEANCPVHPETTVGMLLTFLRTRNGGPLLCHERSHEIARRWTAAGRPLNPGEPRPGGAQVHRPRVIGRAPWRVPRGRC
jgi:hypothetical protein